MALRIMSSCLCLLRHPVLQVKETRQKNCFYVLKRGNNGFISEGESVVKVKMESWL